MSEHPEPRFLTAWERKDHEREKAGLRPLGPMGHRIPERKRDTFDHKASCIVEEHIRVHGQMVPHPDFIKDAIALELRRTWNDAIDAATMAARKLETALTS